MSTVDEQRDALISAYQARLASLYRQRAVFDEANVPVHLQVDIQVVESRLHELEQHHGTNGTANGTNGKADAIHSAPAEQGDFPHLPRIGRHEHDDTSQVAAPAVPESVDPWLEPAQPAADTATEYQQPDELPAEEFAPADASDDVVAEQDAPARFDEQPDHAAEQPELILEEHAVLPAPDAPGTNGHGAYHSAFEHAPAIDDSAVATLDDVQPHADDLLVVEDTALWDETDASAPLADEHPADEQAQPEPSAPARTSRPETQPLPELPSSILDALGQETPTNRWDDELAEQAALFDELDETLQGQTELLDDVTTVDVLDDLALEPAVLDDLALEPAEPVVAAVSMAEAVDALLASAADVPSSVPALLLPAPATRRQILNSAHATRMAEAAALRAAGDVYQQRRMLAEAQEHYNAAFEVYRLGGHVAGQAATSSELGTVARLQHEHAIAIDHYSRAIVLFRSINERHGLGRVHKLMGDVYLDQDDTTQALGQYSEAYTLLKTAGNSLEQAEILHSIGDALYQLGRHDAARERYDVAISTARKADNKTAEADAMLAKSGLLLDTNIQASHELLEEVLALRGDIATMCADLEYYSLLLIERNQWSHAMVYLQRALGLQHALSAPYAHPERVETLIEQVRTAEENQKQLIQQFDPLLQRIAAAASGDSESRAVVAAVLPRLEAKGWQLSAAVEALLDGERNQDVLVASSQPQSASLIVRVLELLHKRVL